MNYIILKLYDFITVLLPVITLYLFRTRYGKTGNRKFYFSLILLFTVYLCAVFDVTGTGTIYHIFQYQLQISQEHINLIPFSRDLDVTGYLLNILLFVPFGFLLPVVWPSTSRWYIAVPAGFAFSLLIETSQLLNIRSTDVDDLIMNTLGTLLGFLAFRLLSLLSGHFPGKNLLKKEKSGTWEPLLYIGAMFLGHFLLYNEFRLAGFLFHF